MKKIRIKICGLNDKLNAAKVAELQPDYMGLILYSGSPRYVSMKTVGIIIRNFPCSIQKVGVLVNEPFEEAVTIAQSGFFDLLQLHGNENPDYCRKLSRYIRLIKAFSVSDVLPSDLSNYTEFCEMFLFDTAGAKHGGNGKSFNHKILLNYSFEKEYILSGGISSEQAAYLKTFNSEMFSAVDLNSRFEIRPGIKDIKLLKFFMEKIRENDTGN